MYVSTAVLEMMRGVNGIAPPKGSHAKHVVCFHQEHGVAAQRNRRQEPLSKPLQLRECSPHDQRVGEAAQQRRRRSNAGSFAQRSNTGVFFEHPGARVPLAG